VGLGCGREGLFLGGGFRRGGEGRVEFGPRDGDGSRAAFLERQQAAAVQGGCATLGGALGQAWMILTWFRRVKTGFSGVGQCG